MTSRQEKFAREMVAGKSQADAYREAFPRSARWKESAVHSRASALAKSAEVAQLVEELRREADAAAIMDCRELRVALSARVREIVAEKGPTAELCRAADTLARVSGWLAPNSQAVAVAVSEGIISPEERARKWRELVGLPPVKDGNWYDGLAL